MKVEVTIIYELYISISSAVIPKLKKQPPIALNPTTAAIFANLSVCIPFASGLLTARKAPPLIACSAWQAACKAVDIEYADIS